MIVKCVLLVISFVLIVHCDKLQEKYVWEEVDFAWRSPKHKQDAINAGKYIESHNLPLGVEVWKNKMFITIPR